MARKDAKLQRKKYRRVKNIQLRDFAALREKKL